MPGHIAVCSKLPNGIVLSHPMDHNKRVEIKGLNKSVIVGAPYATTMIDADFWEQWIAANAEFTPVKSGAIFTAKNDADAQAKAKEFEKRKTGLEGLTPKSHGVEPANEKKE